jgi:hypothetical protein
MLRTTLTAQAIDDVLAGSFPASDPPAWTPGMARPAPEIADGAASGTSPVLLVPAPATARPISPGREDDVQFATHNGAFGLRAASEPERCGGGTKMVGVANVRATSSTPGQAIGALMQQVQAEYAEMPGLSVTLSQARRLWAVDQGTCEEVFSRLGSSGVLRKTTKGHFIRA